MFNWGSWCRSYNKGLTRMPVLLVKHALPLTQYLFQHRYMESKDILDVHEAMEAAVSNLLAKVEPEDFLETRRALALELVQYVQVTAAKTIVAMRLLSDLLPQPNCPDSKEHTYKIGAEAMSYVAEALDESFASQAAEVVGDGTFNQEEVAELLPAVQGMTLEAITFMENRRWPDSDIEQDEGEGSEPEVPVGGDQDGGTGGGGGDDEALLPGSTATEMCRNSESTRPEGDSEVSVSAKGRRVQGSDDSSKGQQRKGSHKAKKAKTEGLATGPKGRGPPPGPDGGTAGLRRFMCPKPS